MHELREERGERGSNKEKKERQEGGALTLCLLFCVLAAWRGFHHEKSKMQTSIHEDYIN